MPMMTCWFDKDGTLINIGDWDYQIRTVVVGEQEVEIEVPDDYELQEGETWADETLGAKKIKRLEPVYEEQVTNPPPDGAYTQEIEIVEGPDGGLYPEGRAYPETPAQRVASLESENALLALELAQTQLRLDQAEHEQAALLLELVTREVI